VDALRAEMPDLILLDMLLPVGGGNCWGLLNQIRGSPKWQSIPVVIVTALGIACDEWAESLGAQAVVRKPIDSDELVLKLQRYYA
jgi:CheY-like chemotaxis protein